MNCFWTSWNSRLPPSTSNNFLLSLPACRGLAQRDLKSSVRWSTVNFRFRPPVGESVDPGSPAARPAGTAEGTAGRAGAALPTPAGGREACRCALSQSGPWLLPFELWQVRQHCCPGCPSQAFREHPATLQVATNLAFVSQSGPWLLPFEVWQVRQHCCPGFPFQVFREHPATLQVATSRRF